MIKFSQYFFPLLVLIFSCKINNSAKTKLESGAIDSSIYKPFDSVPKVSHQTKEIQKFELIEEKRGLQRMGPFRMYSKVIPSEGAFYSGNPKLEILGSKNEVLKSIDVLSQCSLFKNNQIKFDFKEDLQQNYFLVELPNSDNREKYLDKKGRLPKPYAESDLLLELSYMPKSDVILIGFTYYTMNELELYGSESEIVIYDTSGNELNRVRVNGFLSGVDWSTDHKLLAIGTGGELNEDSSMPKACKIFEMQSNPNIIFENETKEGECIGCGILKNGLITVMKEESCNGSYKMKELFLLDYVQDIKLFPSSSQFCPPKSEVKFFDDYCVCHQKKGSKTKIYYSDFKAIVLNSNKDR